MFLVIFFVIIIDAASAPHAAAECRQATTSTPRRTGEEEQEEEVEVPVGVLVEVEVEVGVVGG